MKRIFEDARLRRRCRSLLRELGIRPPLDVPELCRRLAAQRGRPLRLVPYPIEVPGPFGLWFMTDTADVIFYQEETTRPHQDHIILHEIGHVIADHPSDESDEDVWLDDGSPPPDGFVKGLRRTCYNSRYEREAELIATIILEWASVLDQLASGPAASDDAAVVRLNSSLGHHRGWL